MSKRTEIVVRKISEVPALPVDRASGAVMQVLIGPDQGAPNFVTRLFTLAPGARIPVHLHELIEHEQVIVEGEMVLGDGTGERTVRVGDCVFIPAAAGHWYENRGPAAAKFICVVPRTDNYGTRWL
jgi:quercetin dioxygenase-like cupin family protein